jgi:hypothetical protein
MSNREKPGLRRMDSESILPAELGSLSPEEIADARKKYLENMVELDRDKRDRVTKSNTAENDLDVAIDTVRRLDQERKVYSHKAEGETGSGSYELRIKGGDTKFIVAILTVVGVIALAVVLIFALR